MIVDKGINTKTALPASNTTPLWSVILSTGVITLKETPSGEIFTIETWTNWPGLLAWCYTGRRSIIFSIGFGCTYWFWYTCDLYGVLLCNAAVQDWPGKTSLVENVFSLVLLKILSFPPYHFLLRVAAGLVVGGMLLLYFLRNLITAVRTRMPFSLSGHSLCVKLRPHYKQRGKS